MRYLYKLKTVTVRVSDSQPLDHVSGRLADSPAEAIAIAHALFSHLDADQEQFAILALSSNHKVTGYKVLTSGTRTQTLVDVPKLFRTAIELDACGIIAIHNHPSENTEPSSDDYALTKRLVNAGSLLGVPLHDHIILAGRDSRSLRRFMPELFTPIEH